MGDKHDLWEKIMKEIKLKRYAGPFDEVPFDNFIQSPIGLVQKDGGRQTRLIFHLSYDFKAGNKSLNFHTLKDKCTVKYNDIDYAVKLSFIWRGSDGIFYTKTDLKSAFHILGLSLESFKWLVMKAEDPSMGEIKYFIDKCLPFGASISCSHFKHFSNAIKHIFESNVHQELIVTNYLDDFIFVRPSLEGCNCLVSSFLELCNSIGVPVAQEKTEWAT